MAKTKSKNDIKLIVGKKNSVVTKRGSKKPTQVKKKIEVVDEVKKEEIQETEIIKKPIKKKTTTTIKDVNESKIEKELTQEEIIAQRKERNRKKYQNQQKKYQDSQKTKTKKKVIVEDKIDDKLKKNDTVKEEDLVKKIKEKEEKSEEKAKEKERKEKRKTNRKTIIFTQTITTIKDISISKISDVKEKTNDNNIPVGKTRGERVKRSRRIIKEAIVYSILLTIINTLCIIFIDDFNFLRLFDIKSLNIAVTVIISLIFNFFVAYMVDYFITVIWLKKRRKKKVGEEDGNNRTIEGEHQENIQDQEGE